MPIEFPCPDGHRLRAPRRKRGLLVPCPVCGQSVQVPATTVPPAPDSSALRPSSSQTALSINARSIEACRPDPGRVRSARGLAVALGVMVVFSVVPALRHWNLETAPGWARVVLGVGLLQGVYLLWMVALPDWAGLRVLGAMFAFSAAIYAAATALTLFTPLDTPLPLDLDKHRWSAPRWSIAVLLVLGLAAYLCGRASGKWRFAWALRERLRGE